MNEWRNENAKGMQHNYVLPMSSITYFAISNRFVASPRWIRSMAPISIARSCNVVAFPPRPKKKDVKVDLDADFRSVVK